MKFINKLRYISILCGILVMLSGLPAGLAQDRGDGESAPPGVNSQGNGSEGVFPEDFGGGGASEGETRERPSSRRSTPPKKASPTKTAEPADTENPTPLPTLIPAPTASVRSNTAISSSSIPVVPIQAPPAPENVRKNPINADDLDYGAIGSIETRKHYSQNRSIRYAIEVQWNGTPNEVQVEVPETPELLNLQKVAGPEKKSHQGEDGKVRLIWEYTLKPVTEGDASVGPIIVTARHRNGENLPPVHLAQSNIIISPSQMGWIAWAALIVGGVFFLLILLWLLMILSSFNQNRKHQDAMQDSHPSLDERLLSEVDTLQVSLLRGNLAGYYEKISTMTRQIMKGRGFLDRTDLSTGNAISQLRASGAENSLVESVESILHRCDAVVQGGEKPDHAAQEHIAQDLKALIRNKAISPRMKDKLAEDSNRPQTTL